VIKLNNEFTIIDLFAGSGGLSEGFFKLGFQFVSHIEMDKNACMTLKTRSLYHYFKANKMEDLYYDYLKGEISREDFLKKGRHFLDPLTIINTEISLDTRFSILTKIKKRMKKLNIKKIDLIIGGPPCQSYSLVGRSRASEKMKRDPRNYLYLHYLYFIKNFKPKIFLFENVPGMKSAGNGKYYNDFIKKAENLGYSIESQILDAKDFLVLQNRKRLILIGWKNDYNLHYPTFERVNHNYLVKDILDDLPPLNPGEGKDEPQNFLRSPSEYLIKSNIRTKKDVLIQHRARNHNERDREIYRYVIYIWNKEKRRIKYDELPDKLKKFKNKNVFKDKFKIIASDLKWAQCITAHISKDGHYYIHPDINQARSITVREAARIQSFPDNFKFEGSRTAQFRQIGNAVPPLMAEKIALKIKEMLEEA